MYQVPDDLIRDTLICIQNANHSKIAFIQVAEIIKKLSECKIEEGEDT